MTHCWRAVPKCFWVASVGGAECFILSVGVLRVWCSQRMLRVWILSVPALRASYSQRRPLRVWFSALFFVLLRYAKCGGYVKNNNRQYWQLPIKDFGQQRLNGGADWSAAKAGQVLPHFQQILSGALTLPCPIAGVFWFLCGQSLVGRLVGWSVSRSAVQSKIRVPGLEEFPSKRKKIHNSRHSREFAI